MYIHYFLYTDFFLKRVMSEKTEKFGLIKYSNPDICIFCKCLHDQGGESCSSMFNSNKHFQINKKNIFRNLKKLHGVGRKKKHFK